MRMEAFERIGLSPFDFSDEQFVRYSVCYVGSATQETALTRQSVGGAVSKFSANGTAAGRAAVVKNTIQMHISSVGINLIDKSCKLFVTRNYPLKTIAGFCHHQGEPKLFAFASHPPGSPKTVIKVHVFKALDDPTTQIINSMRFWLRMETITV
jgi:hypothetical protein